MSGPGWCAAVDVGSNSVRLLVLDAHGHRLHRGLVVTRLAEGVDRTGRLDDAAIARTVVAIEGFRDRWRGLGVEDRVRIAATSAVRDAVDRDRFLAAVRAATGVAVEVVPGEEEARLAFVGAASGVVAPVPTAVVDVGGGSTEVVVGDAMGRPVAAVSLPLGCVRMTERHLAGDPPTAREVAAARATIAEVVDGGVKTLGPAVDSVAGLVAVAGTATTLAALHLGLARYEEDRIHGAVVPRAALDALVERLVALDTTARAALGPMQPGRADVIHGGALVLAAVVARLRVDAVIVSERDGLDALAASLLPDAPAERP